MHVHRLNLKTLVFPFRAVSMTLSEIRPEILLSIAFTILSRPQGRGVLPYSGLYGEAPPEMDASFKLTVILKGRENCPFST